MNQNKLFKIENLDGEKYGCGGFWDRFLCSWYRPFGLKLKKDLCTLNCQLEITKMYANFKTTSDLVFITFRMF
jgi:hypothetical protein